MDGDVSWWGDAITRWLARVAVVCYAISVGYQLLGLREQTLRRHARWWWTAGAGIFLIHVAAAFHYFYQWSHAIAYEAVRQRSYEMAGWDSGVGLYLNYAFTMCWVLDVLWWWIVDRPMWPWLLLLHAFMAFMVFNGTIVFGPPGWVLAWLALGIWFAIAAMIRRHWGLPASPQGDC